MNQNNLLDVVNFMKKNKTFSDYKLINNFMSNLNFTKYRFNNSEQKGGNNIDNNSSAKIFEKKDLSNANINNNVLFGGDNDIVSEPVVDQNLGIPNPSIPDPSIPDPSMPNPSIPNPSMPDPSMPNLGLPNLGLPGPGMPPSEQIQIPTASIGPLGDGIPINSLPIMGKELGKSSEQDEMIIPEVEELSEKIDNFGQSQLEIGVVDNADCIYKKIRNPDGTQVTQKICGQKIITMPDMFLPRPTFAYSGINTYTIRKGTILYHATVNKRGFNTKEIRLGKDKLISFFTPNFRLASDKIEGCSIDKQKGFIHVFEVKADIPDVFIKLPYDTDEDLDLDELKDKFCNANEYYKGVGFFYPKNEIELFNNSIFNQRTQEMHENLDDDSYYSEFALCSPNDYLTYLYSQKCMSLRKLSQPYRFDGKNYN